MAVKIMPRLHQGGDPETMKFEQVLMKQDMVRKQDFEKLTETDGMIIFDRIRATSAWSETRKFDEGAILDMDMTSIPMTKTFAEKSPLSFHMTTMKSLKGIVDSGLIPGGKRRNRSCNFFSAFPPFGRIRRESSVRWEFHGTINLSSEIMSGLLLLVMSSNVLCGAYDGRIDLDGHVVTNQTIPFLAFDSAWYGLWNNAENSMEWRKILISKEERKRSNKVVTGIMENRGRAPRNPKWGDLASRAFEAVGIEDSNVSIGRIDAMVQRIPEKMKKSEIMEAAWSALHNYVAINLPIDYERQICPNCTAWVSTRLNICSECYAEFTSSREIHTISLWEDREGVRRRTRD